MDTREQRINTLHKHITRLAKLVDQAPEGAREVLFQALEELFAAQGELRRADLSPRLKVEEESQKRTAQSKKETSLTQAFAEAGLDYQKVLKTVTKQIGNSFGDACVLLLLSGDGKQLETASYYHPARGTAEQTWDMLGVMKTRADEGVAATVLGHSETVLLLEPEDTLRSLVPREHWSAYEHSSLCSALLVSLRALGRLIGMLGVVRFEPGEPHTGEEEQLLKNIAEQAALAIENARLYAAEAQRARALDGLHTATAALLSTLDLDELLGRILDAAQSAIPAAEKGMLHLVAPDSGKLQTSALLGYAEAPIKVGTHESISEYIVQAVRERRPLLISDTEIPPPQVESGQEIEDHPIRSTIIAPLMLGESVLGVLSLNASQPRAFTEADLRVLESFAATTSAAIQNARLHAKVQKMAITDPLTGLYNRRGFYELGKREIERVRRFGHPLSAIMLDIDLFKMINDTYGHASGDQVLKAIAERLNHNIRGVDILGRYGGDEFSILLPETDLATANVIAGRLRRAIAKYPISTDDGLLSITISVGIAKATEEMSDLDALLNLADSAMYSAKQGGRDRVELGEVVE